jgi:hypothetical protein
MLKKISLKNLSISLLLILIGFSFGNFFGISSKITQNSFIFIFISIFFVELIGFFQYSKNNMNNQLIIEYLNTLKRGFLIGILVEAFKVGS